MFPMRTSAPLFFPAKSQIDYRANCLHLCFTSLARWTGLFSMLSENLRSEVQVWICANASSWTQASHIAPKVNSLVFCFYLELISEQHARAHQGF